MNHLSNTLLFKIWIILIIFLIGNHSNTYSQSDDSEHKLKIGGAARFNYFYKSWDETNKKKGGEFNYDMTRINVDDEYKNVLLSTEVRFYSKDFGGILVHHAWAGYKFSETSHIELGITKTPFGILPYASHNWFFNIHYYLGLEDDYDAGIKYVLNKEKFNFQAAFFKNSEFPSRNYSRYSYDISDPQEEINQVNLRATYDVKSIKFGGSLQYGQLMNTETKEVGDHNAGAFHVNATFKRFNILLQVISVNHNPIDSITNVVRMAAYGASYSVASDGMVYSAGLQYKIPLKWGPVTELNLYDNFGVFDKANNDFYDTYMNVLGFSVAIGKMFIYVDWASGINQPWIGPSYESALAAGDPGFKWHSRFNTNFGYYF